MSCWIVSKEHVDMMTAVILRSEAVPEAGVDPDKIGATLWRENCDSFTYRYDNRYPEDLPTEEYKYDAPTEIPTDLFYLYKLFGCYDYQSCEHPEWKASEAYGWVKKLTDMWLLEIRKDFPNFHVDSNKPGYDTKAYRDAPWGI